MEYINRVAFLFIFIFFLLGHYPARADDYPWHVDGRELFPSDKYETIPGFYKLWEHVLSYYPDKYGCEVYKAWRFHNLCFEVVMETNPESLCKNNEKIVTYRGFWEEGDIVCQWAFYEDLGSKELWADMASFYKYFLESP